MKTLLLISALSAPLVLSGCVISVHDDDEHGYSIDTEDRETNNRHHIANLNLGDSLESVTRKMGVADFDELKQTNEGAVRVLYYRTQKVKSDGVTTKDECTPIIFLDNQISAWGELGLNNL
ncbi:DUF3192 domain-containing protein [Alteromonas sp. 5E99-2]|uniref:DUF3192 domain-containing protein n=1 Tax=Alteromonas sp. 5E99-2 TaxID=2817683 RepID=UPI001A980860|nr:DUF3192 domain-containing protein [Alteromonas sp. 5E99-2]MBO1254116.1 DUF3192 domain-containing protein [Alteromonas sp. 5E99-2]